MESANAAISQLNQFTKGNKSIVKEVNLRVDGAGACKLKESLSN